MLKIEINPAAGVPIIVNPKNTDAIEITVGANSLRTVTLTFAEFRDFAQSCAGLVAFMTMQRMAEENALRNTPTDGGTH